MELTKEFVFGVIVFAGILVVLILGDLSEDNFMLVLLTLLSAIMGVSAYAGGYTRGYKEGRSVSFEVKEKRT
jgi:hypothetical protein